MDCRETSAAQKNQFAQVNQQITCAVEVDLFGFI
jgi:hypothetical protein